MLVTATDALGTHKRLEPVKVAGKLNIPGRQAESSSDQPLIPENQQRYGTALVSKLF